METTLEDIPDRARRGARPAIGRERTGDSRQGDAPVRRGFRARSDDHRADQADRAQGETFYRCLSGNPGRRGRSAADRAVCARALAPPEKLQIPAATREVPRDEGGRLALPQAGQHQARHPLPHEVVGGTARAARIRGLPLVQRRHAQKPHGPAGTDHLCRRGRGRGSQAGLLHRGYRRHGTPAGHGRGRCRPDFSQVARSEGCRPLRAVPVHDRQYRLGHDRRPEAGRLLPQFQAPASEGAGQHGDDAGTV